MYAARRNVCQFSFLVVSLMWAMPKKESVMGNVMRWRYGDTQPVVLPVDSATVIEVGDLVYLETDDVRPAGQQTDAGSEASNQEAFHDKFAGVAMQRSRAGDTSPIRVATRGVFEFDCASATFEVGALVGSCENG